MSTLVPERSAEAISLICLLPKETNPYFGKTAGGICSQLVDFWACPRLYLNVGLKFPRARGREKWQLSLLRNTIFTGDLPPGPCRSSVWGSWAVQEASVREHGILLCSKAVDAGRDGTRTGLKDLDFVCYYIAFLRALGILSIPSPGRPLTRAHRGKLSGPQAHL